MRPRGYKPYLEPYLFVVCNALCCAGPRCVSDRQKGRQKYPAFAKPVSAAMAVTDFLVV